MQEAVGDNGDKVASFLVGLLVGDEGGELFGVLLVGGCTLHVCGIMSQ